MENLPQLLLAAAVGLVVGMVLLLGVLKLMGGPRFGTARTAFWCALRSDEFANRLVPLVNPPPPKPELPPKPSGAPLRMLAVLQRDGRLLDFLMEDLTGVSDEQIGAAVRSIHQSCQAALGEHLVLDSVFPQDEEEPVDVPANFDPSAIRLTGNVPAQGPFRGTLKHRGWRVKEIKLAPPPEGQDEFVLQPAEVEIPDPAGGTRAV
jgi:hypothetical protein